MSTVLADLEQALDTKADTKILQKTTTVVSRTELPMISSKAISASTTTLWIRDAVNRKIASIDEIQDGAEQDKALANLIKGDSPNGYITKNGEKVESLDGFLEFVNSLRRRQAMKMMKSKDGLKYILLYFPPHGYQAITGEALTEKVLNCALEQDRAAGWNLPAVDDRGIVLNEVGPALQALKDTAKVHKWMAVMIEGSLKILPLLELQPPNLVAARVISFVLDKRRNLVGWAPGVYIWGMDVASLTKRAVLSPR